VLKFNEPNRFWWQFVEMSSTKMVSFCVFYGIMKFHMGYTNMIDPSKVEVNPPKW
jgi:hypothetical protein